MSYEFRESVAAPAVEFLPRLRPDAARFAAPLEEIGEVHLEHRQSLACAVVQLARDVPALFVLGPQQSLERSRNCSDCFSMRDCEPPTRPSADALRRREIRRVCGTFFALTQCRVGTLAVDGKGQLAPIARLSSSSSFLNSCGWKVHHEFSHQLSFGTSGIKARHGCLRLYCCFQRISEAGNIDIFDTNRLGSSSPVARRVSFDRAAIFFRQTSQLTKRMTPRSSSSKIDARSHSRASQIASSPALYTSSIIAHDAIVGHVKQAFWLARRVRQRFFHSLALRDIASNRELDDVTVPTLQRRSMRFMWRFHPVADDTNSSAPSHRRKSLR